MKITSIGLFLSLLAAVVVTGCVEMDFGKTGKQPEPVAEEPVQKRYEKVTASRLNLRERGSSKARILAVLQRDEPVEILTVKKGYWSRLCLMKMKNLIYLKLKPIKCLQQFM